LSDRSGTGRSATLVPRQAPHQLGSTIDDNTVTQAKWTDRRRGQGRLGTTTPGHPEMGEPSWNADTPEGPIMPILIKIQRPITAFMFGWNAHST